MPFDLDKNVDLTHARTVLIGGRELKIAPLKLRSILQAADMLPALAVSEGVPSAQIGKLIDFVMLGLQRAHPQLTHDELLESEATVPELRIAVDAVIEQAGGVKKKEADVGELKATSEQDSLGTSSSPSSALN